jgi:hypothetical protein
MSAASQLTIMDRLLYWLTGGLGLISVIAQATMVVTP